MIPEEVAALAELITPNYQARDEETQDKVIASAWRIYNDGWRKPA